MLRPGEIYRKSARRLGEKDKMKYPEGYRVKRVSTSGHLAHEGSNFHMGEAYAGCRVGLFENESGTTELHYANLHLGNLEFNGRDPYRPESFIVGPKEAAGSIRKKKQGTRRK